jgi:hypothetical protein
MGAVKTHNANRVKVIWGGITMQELGKDEFLRIKFNADDYSLAMSVDGQGTRERSNDGSATMEVILLATSATNRLLTAARQTGLALPNGIIAPFSARDLNSDAELHFGAETWIKKQPDRSWARGVSELIWTFETDAMDSFHAGH